MGETAVRCLMTMVLVGTGVFASPARADRLDAKERKARIECSAGNSAEGVRLLAELWVATGDATWLYNQGRCYEQNGQSDLAASRFREYLRKAEKLPPEDVESVNRRIEELERRAAGRSASPPAVITLVQPAPVLLAPASAPPTAPPARTVELTSSPPPSPAADSPFYTRWWFWTGVGVAVVGGVAAAVLLSRGGNESPACDPGVPCVP